MSSWILAKGSLSSNVPTKKEIISYHDTSSATSFPEIYLQFIMATIYTKKFNETCYVWDPSGILRLSIKSNPLVSILKEKPSIDPNSLDLYKPIISGMKFNEIKKYISNIFEYNDRFNTLVNHVIETIDLKRKRIDLSIHLTESISLDKYVEMVKTYQANFNMNSILIFVMGSSNLIKEFKSLADSTWKIIRIKDETTNDTDKFIHSMAEIKMMSTTSSIILDFSNPIDRLIYVSRKSRDELEYFKEVNGMEWFLL